MTKKLFQVLMLAAAVWLARPGTSQASPITVTMSYAAGAFQGNVAEFGSGPSAYDFGLVFDFVTAPFTVSVTADDDPDLSALPPGYTCVPIAGGSNCVLFTVTPSANNWVGNFTLNISWLFDTNALYPNTPVGQSGLGRIRILHLGGTGPVDVTLPNSYCTTCGVDPAIGGQADNFSGFIVAQTNVVPEPATLVLFGSGLAALVARYRRRRVSAASRLRH